MPGESRKRASSRKNISQLKQPHGKHRCYLEIYINESGNITFMPLTNATCGILNGVSTKYRKTQTHYCG
ncbi:MAG: hypothetical protein WC695_04670 [Candidatus Omnitrophota bacterium]